VERGSAIVTAIIAAITAVLVAVVGLVPNLGRLRKLERVVAILEKIDPGDKDARTPLIHLRDRLIDGLVPRATVARYVATCGWLIALGGFVEIWLATDTTFTIVRLPDQLVMGVIVLAVGVVAGGIATIVVVVREREAERRSQAKTWEQRNARKRTKSSAS
jgi:hypothetical protein